jgi:hypothetical protein
VKRSCVAASLAVLAATTIATLLGSAGTAPAMAAADPTVTVTWPDATRLNPTVTPYQFIVTDHPDAAYLYWTWGRSDTPVSQVYGTRVPDSGEATVDFADYQGSGVVRIWVCPADSWSSACTEAARSPELDVWSKVQVIDLESVPPKRRSGSQHVPFWYGPKPPLAGTPTGTWELLDADKVPLDPAVGGALTAQDLAYDPDTGDSDLEFTIPDGLPSGSYYVEVHMSVDTADFGHLEGSLTGSQGAPLDIYVDNDAPTLTVRKTVPVLYPVADEYLDYFKVYAKASEPATATFEVTNSHGQRVYRSTGHSLDADDYNYYDPPVWNGRQGGKVVPEGRYTATLTAKDLAGNTATWSAKVTVSHKSLQWTMFKRTVTAAGSMVGKPYIGKCATLARPAKGGPKGSLGFYSATKCHGTLATAGVATTHGIYIPKAFRNHWDYAQVILNGGPATSAKGNYIELGYLRPRSKKVWNARFFTKGDGAHRGMKFDLAPTDVFDHATDKPFILWYNGATAGSRYNVRSYTVLVRYQALR